MDGAPERLTPEHLMGLKVRMTVSCVSHGSHTAEMSGPFLDVIDAVQLFRSVATERGRWVLCEYQALDWVPEQSVSEWD
jgi:hypothetical protein